MGTHCLARQGVQARFGTAAHAAMGQALWQVNSTEGCSGWETQAACVPAGARHDALLHQEGQCSSEAMHDCNGPAPHSREQ